MNDPRIQPGDTIADPLNRLQHMAGTIGAKVRGYESGRIRVTWSNGDWTWYGTALHAEADIGLEAERLAYLANIARGS